MDDVLERLRVCRARINQLKQELRAEHARRDGLLVQAISEPRTYREVSAAVGLSPSRIANIIAAPTEVL